MSHSRLAQSLTVLAAALLLLSPIAVPHPAAAASSGVAGRAYHLVTLEPISGALVTVDNAQEITDAQGFYKLALPAGRYTVAAQAAGYISMSQMLQPVGDNLTTVDFAMIPLDAGDEMNTRIVEQLALPQQEIAPEVLAQVEENGFAPSAVTQLPTTIRLAVRRDPAQANSEIVEVITLPFEDYIKGVIPFEMSPSYPLEALKAQAVAARSYAAANLNKHAADGADVCSSVHCQVWRPTHYATTDRAVDETRGMAATYDGNIISAFFHGHCDGHTRNSEDVWSAALPYCRAVACPCGYTTLWGHGVGMCQEGARAMATAGATFDQIITHYYTGVSLLSEPTATVSEGRVEPVSGGESTTFRFRVRYSVPTGTPPPIANVIVDGRAHSLVRDGGSAAEGWTYSYTTRLVPGSHNYRYEFDDGYGRLTRFPATGTSGGPTVTPEVPAPPPSSDLSGSITASTALDWVGGQMDHTEIIAADKDLLTLATGQNVGSYTSPVLDAGAPFVAYGLMWYADGSSGATVTFETRSSLDGTSWTPWHTESGEAYTQANARLQSAELVFGETRYLQYRVSLTGTTSERPLVRNIRIVCIDSRAGPLAAEFDAPAQATLATPTIISRAQWGANESWMTWAPEYRTVKAMVLHHTVTSDGGLDPAWVVRAIYAYHALPEPEGRGWGDIGYNYLIDHDGRIYEGRYGGSGVVGAHAFQYNWGSAGIGMIGDFEEDPVPPALYDSLTTYLAYLCSAWGIDPVGTTYLVDKFVPTLVGHTTLFPPPGEHQTQCPGQYFIPLIPSVRADTLAKLNGPPPTVVITTPTSGQQLRGVVTPQYTTSGIITRTLYYVDGALRALFDSLTSWKWNTTLYPDGPHTLRMVVENAAGSAESAVTITVDNTAPAGTATAPVLDIRSADTHLHFWRCQRSSLQSGLDLGGRGAGSPDGCIRERSVCLRGSGMAGPPGARLWGAWYGPYTCALPPAAYQVLYRLRTDNVSADVGLATLDIAGNGGATTYALQAVHANNLTSTGYQEIPLTLAYGSAIPSCLDGENGLEFRTWYSGAGNLWLDRVRVFTAPVARADIHLWPTPAMDGPVRITVRLLDLAGNASEQELIVGVDHAQPTWQGPHGSGYWGKDLLAGMDVTQGAWQQSLDGGSAWSDWQPLTIHASSGERGYILFYSSVPTTGLVRYRAVDRAGNASVSPTVLAGLGLPPKDERVFLPLVTR